MRKPIGIVVTGCIATLAILAACGRDDQSRNPCDLTPPVHGVVIFESPLDLLVRDASGRGQALGDTAITYGSRDSMVSRSFDTLHIRAGFTQPGTYTVRVKRRYYNDAVVSGIRVAVGDCGGAVPTQVQVKLELAPGAPALRSVQVLGADFLYAPGVQRQLTARVDADPSVPTTVDWRLSDTTLARIDGTGLVTTRCSTRGGADTATALATADTLVRGSATFGVAMVKTCP